MLLGAVVSIPMAHKLVSHVEVCVHGMEKLWSLTELTLFESAVSLDPSGILLEVVPA